MAGMCLGRPAEPSTWQVLVLLLHTIVVMTIRGVGAMGEVQAAPVGQDDGGPHVPGMHHTYRIDSAGIKKT